jgi:hypothetical protein
MIMQEPALLLLKKSQEKKQETDYLIIQIFCVDR